MEMRIKTLHRAGVAGVAAAGMLAVTLVGLGGGHAHAAQNPPSETIAQSCVIPQDAQRPANTQGNGGVTTQTAPPPNAQQPGAQASTGPETAIFCVTDDAGSSYAVAVDPESCVVISMMQLPADDIQDSAQTAPEQGNTQQNQPQVQGVPSQDATGQGGMTQNGPVQAQAGSVSTDQGIACAFASNTDDQTESIPAQVTTSSGAICTIVLTDGATAPQVGDVVTGQVVACDASGAPESGSSNSSNSQPGTSTVPAQPTEVAPPA